MKELDYNYELFKQTLKWFYTPAILVGAPINALYNTFVGNTIWIAIGSCTLAFAGTFRYTFKSKKIN